MKIVPSTRKIRASGGISTKVTRSAMRESRPMRAAVDDRAGRDADADAHRGDDQLVGRRRRAACEERRQRHGTTSTPSDAAGEPLSSRIVRASAAGPAPVGRRR